MKDTATTISTAQVNYVRMAVLASRMKGRDGMEYRSLGRTGLKVSALSFGGSSLGSVFRPVEEAEGIRAVCAAVDHGVNFIDTSPCYGVTVAETVLGKALARIPRHRYYLATKAGRYGYKPGDNDFSARRVTEGVDASLRRLNVDYVDLIQAHDIEFGELDQIIEETIPALRKVQQQGKARFVGITGLPFKAFRYVMDRADVDVIQSYCHYCLNDTSLLDMLPSLQSRNVGVISSAPLAMRLLTLDGPPSWHPAPADVRAACMAAARHCQSKGADVARLALQFAVANPDVHTVVVGSASAERMMENIRHAEAPMDEALLNEVRQILRPAMNKTWTQGRPENN